MRVADFLIIGAMKSGTNTLYHDLLRHPSLHLPDKDMNPLVNDISASAYAALFQNARSSQLCGDVSTCYSMLPDYPGVVQRARRMCADDVKIVYIVRDPISRVISHHHHMSVRHDEQRISRDIDYCVRENPSLIAYSCYAMQLEPWLDAFGRENVLVLRFEDYVVDRRAGLQSLSRFIGVDPQVYSVAPATIHNRSEGKPVLNSFWATLTSSAFYRRFIRNLLPLRARDLLRKALLPKSSPRPAEPSPATVAMLIDRLQPEVDRLRQMLGHDELLWDLTAHYSGLDSTLPRCA